MKMFFADFSLIDEKGKASLGFCQSHHHLSTRPALQGISSLQAHFHKGMMHGIMRPSANGASKGCLSRPIKCATIRNMP